MFLQKVPQKWSKKMQDDPLLRRAIQEFKGDLAGLSWAVYHEYMAKHPELTPQNPALPKAPSMVISVDEENDPPTETSTIEPDYKEWCMLGCEICRGEDPTCPRHDAPNPPKAAGIPHKLISLVKGPA